MCTGCCLKNGGAGGGELGPSAAAGPNRMHMFIVVLSQPSLSQSINNHNNNYNMMLSRIISHIFQCNQPCDRQIVFKMNLIFSKSRYVGDEKLP